MWDTIPTMNYIVGYMWANINALIPSLSMPLSTFTVVFIAPILISIILSIIALRSSEEDIE